MFLCFWIYLQEDFFLSKVFWKLGLILKDLLLKELALKKVTVMVCVDTAYEIYIDKIWRKGESAPDVNT